MIMAGTGSGLIQGPGHGRDREMNLGEGRNLNNEHGSGRERGREPELGSGQWRGCGLSRGSVQGRGLVLSLGQDMDGLELVVKIRPSFDPRVKPQPSPYPDLPSPCSGS